MSEFKELDINADRICEAISKIGYNPSSAILDIVDNSFVANAEHITIQLFIKEGMTLNKSQNIDKIQIIDNGVGMSDIGIQKALELGSNVTYNANSLSKYGLGLKSAGFSLGRRIEVVSKEKNKAVSKKYFLDRDEILAKGKFGYLTEDPSENQLKNLESYESGTIITITNLIYTSKVTAGKIIEHISKKAGVNYCEYLKVENVIFKIQIIKSQDNVLKTEKEKVIVSKDMLFWDEANENFNKEDYDCKKPSKVLDDYFDNPLNIDGEKIRIQASIFPKDSMKSYPGFNDSEKNRIKDYEVGQANSGFYFYRNGRLIKWGEQLFLNREFGFRAKISFSTEHDDLFDVDVSKQHLTVSEEVESILKNITSIPRSQSKEAFEICDKLLKSSKETGNEGTEFNLKNSTLEEEEEETPNIDAAEVSNRKEKLEKKSEEQDTSDTPKYENELEKEAFRRIRYWEKGRNLWESGTDRLEGTYVLIDKLHPYYDLVLNDLEASSPVRQAIEALFHALAVGQIQTIQKFTDVNDDTMIKIFEKFCRSTSHQLDNWVNNNWNLFDNESK
jgi:hypothetical protein